MWIDKLRSIYEIVNYMTIQNPFPLIEGAKRHHVDQDDYKWKVLNVSNIQKKTQSLKTVKT
jgi:hypothetical protein